MRKTLLNPVFLVCILMAAINQIVEKGFGVYIPVIHSYLDDVLCFPIVLTLGLAMYRFFKPNYRLGFWHMCPVLVIYSVYFEWFLPQTSHSYIGDYMDLIAYLCGLAIFGYFINNENSLDLKQTH